MHVSVMTYIATVIYFYAIIFFINIIINSTIFSDIFTSTVMLLAQVALNYQ